MPEIQYAVRLANEAGTVDDIGAVFQNRLQQPRIFARIVLQVGVLHDNNIAGRLLETTPQGGAFALITGLIENADFTALQLLENGARVVGAAIIYNNDL